MTHRAEQKRQSLERILKVASVRMREQGINGAAIAPVMREAGLTHGAFYSHFQDKNQLAREAFDYALQKGQPHWFGSSAESWRDRLKRLAASYLNTEHRDDVGHGCAISALIAEVPNADKAFQQSFSAAIQGTLKQICECDGDEDAEAKYDDAIVFLALCVGGINLARAVDNEALSKRILRICAQQAANVD